MLDLPPEVNTLALEKPKSGSVPAARLDDAAKAQQIVWQLIDADKERSKVNARVQGSLDGNAPFSFTALEREGQANRTNVNFREGEANSSMAKTPYYDLFAESATYAQVRARAVNKAAPYEQDRWSRIQTEKFHDLLRDWSGFDWNMQMMISDMVDFGRGYLMWPDANNWQFYGVKHHRVYVPDGTLSNIERCEIFVVRQSCMVHELYGYVKDAAAAKGIGWEPEEVLRACWRATPESTAQNATYDYVLTQQMLRNHDLYESVRSQTVRIAHLFIKEFNGRISHLIVEESKQGYGQPSGTPPPPPSPNDEKPQFLFKSIGRFGCLRNVVAQFLYDIGDGTLHSIKGLAVKMYPFVEIKNRLNCAIVDNAFVSMSVLLKPTTARAVEQTALMYAGPLAILPPNYEVTQWGIAGRMEEGLAIERALSVKLESNIGQYRSPLMKKDGNPETATQISYEAGKEAALSKGAVNRFYSQLDQLFAEVYRRACNPNLTDDNGGPNTLALEFQRQCEEAGVPKESIQKPDWVRASRAMGNGSIFLRQQTIAATSSLVPMMNQAGQQNWLNDSIGALAGVENVARWNPQQGTSPELADQAAYAALENNALKDGSPVLWTPTQNDLTHAQVHLKAGGDALMSTTQGGDPAAVVTFIDAVIGHTQEHLARIQKNPAQAGQAKMIAGNLMQLEKLNTGLKRQLQAAQQQQAEQAQQTQQVMSDQQLDEMQVQHKMRMAQMKTDQAIALKEEKAQQGREKHQQDMVLADASTAGEIQRQNSKAQADTLIKARNKQTTGAQ